MARKEASEAVENKAFQDMIGIIMLSMFFLLLVALFSFERYDLSLNRVPANEHVRNWIGPVGAHLAYACFFSLGAAAYLVPVLFLGLGLGNLLPAVGYLKRRWPWILCLIIATAGVFDLFSDSSLLSNGLKENLNTPSPGGFVGQTMNQYFFGRFFGLIGATTIFITVYLVSLLGLINVSISDWVQAWRERRTVTPTPDTEKEKALDIQARELAKQALKLQVEVEKAGLGPDLQPVPEPTVRDLSVPQTSANTASPAAAKGLKTPSETTPADKTAPTTPATIPPATTTDILGGDKAKTSPAQPATVKPDEDDGPPTPVAPVVPYPKPRQAVRKPQPIAVAATPVIGNYQLPSGELLGLPDPNVRPTETKEELMANARLMQNTLAQFDIEVAVGDITKGPTITRYELHPAPGVRLEKITALSNNIAAALKAENVHILAPIPGKSSVGVEVPNAIKTKVIMRELLESEEWTKSKAKIPLALGKDVYGQPIIADLAEMPHLLIAGSTGSGKSVCINAIIASLLYRFPPDQLRFVMIDPKVVELQHYNSLPHLVVPVVTDPKKVILALRWVVSEMEKRYQIFARVGVRNIKSFNERPKNKPARTTEPELPLTMKKERVETSSEGFAVELDEEIVVPRDEDIIIPEKLSYVVVIIDELADLMLVAPADVEMAIARITQMARAAGIHCIVATQRPSVDVITGVIKANIPARIAFQVAAKVDSRTILDAMGADKLLGKGDMLYLPPGSSKLIRAQGALITDQEIQGIVNVIAKQGKPSYEIEIHQQLSQPVGGFEGESGCDEDEELIQQCIEVIRSEQKASVSLMQRRLRLGYTRAARIMDELENRGIVGPSKGAEPRDILIDLDGEGADGNPVEPAT
jgi:DNA segregation ATPase FtsK/SpoIIIE, S-DNA-T family